MVVDAALASTRELLDRGWWRAHDRGLLDADGVPTQEVDSFPFETEAERMAQLAGILGIPGEGVPYPFIAWRTFPSITWSAFEFVGYCPKSQAG